MAPLVRALATRLHNRSQSVVRSVLPSTSLRRILSLQLSLDAMPLFPEPITQIGYEGSVAHAAKRRGSASLLVTVDGLDEPSAVERRPYWWDRRLQVRIADWCHFLEEGRLYHGTVESCQLTGDGRVVDLVVHEGIRQRRP